MQISPLNVSLAAGAAVAAAAGTAVYAGLGPGSQIFGRTIVAGNDSAEMALTFDDGPNDAATPQLLELLDRYKARATFFLIGNHARMRPDLVRAVRDAGHLVGNHTMSHPWLAWQTEATIREELGGCSKALEDILGEAVRYFRPPHGARRPAVMRIARELGMQTVQWNVMGHDWEQGIGAAGIQARLDKGLARAARSGRGANILLHDGHDRAMGADRSDTLVCTEALLKRFAGQGCRVVTVDAWGEEAAERQGQKKTQR